MDIRIMQKNFKCRLTKVFHIFMLNKHFLIMADKFMIQNNQINSIIFGIFK